MRKFVILLIVTILFIPAISSMAAEDEGIYEVTIYPNGRGLFRMDSTSNDLVIGDVGVTYSVDRENNEVDISFDESVFVSDVISEGNTMHKDIKFDSQDEVIKVDRELMTSGFMSPGVSNIRLRYDDVIKVDSITIQSDEPDFSGGLLDNKPLNQGKNLIYESTDNDLDTYCTIGGSVTYVFEDLVDIYEARKLDNASGARAIVVSYYNDSGSKITFKDGIYKGVRKVVLSRYANGTNYSLKLFEFNVYGNLSPVEPQDEVSGLDYILQGNNVSLSWTNPSNDKFEGVKIYRDGAYIETTTEESFTETLPVGTYQYRLTTLEAGKESEGVILDVSVQTIPTPVKGVNMINTSSLGGSITWDPNPKAQNISKYIVYVNGQKHGEIENPPYQLEDLEIGKKYDIAVSAVNSLGEGEVSNPVSYTPSEIEDLKSTIKIGEIFSYIAMLFTKVWPLLALTITFILFPHITNAIKSVVRSRRSA